MAAINGMQIVQARTWVTQFEAPHGRFGVNQHIVVSFPGVIQLLVGRVAGIKSFQRHSGGITSTHDMVFVEYVKPNSGAK